MKIFIAAAAFALAACASDAPPSPPPGTPAAAAARINADIAALEDLTAAFIDAEALYREASEIAKEPALKSELLALADERGRLANQFQAETQRMGAAPRTKGAPIGVGHRIFADIRSAFDNKQQTAAGEVLRGENYLLDEMQEKLADPQLSDGVKTFVRGALPTVEAGRNRINVLVEQHRKPG